MYHDTSGLHSLNYNCRVSLGGDVSTMHPNHHGPLHDMVDTYGQHGADNLSLWLTNAKEAAAKITQATKARQREKEEKYGKFLRDLHSRLALFSKEKHLSKIPQARPRRLPFGQIDNSCNLRRSECDGPAVHERGRYPDPIFKEMPKMDKVRVYLEKQLRKNSKGGNGISKLHRECMIQALVKQRAMDSLVEKAYPNDHTSGDKITAPKKTDFTFSKPLPRPLIVSLSATDRAQAPDLVNSEPCTPTGWNIIRTSFSALEMRSIDSATSPTPPDITEAGDLEANFSRALSPRQSKDNPQHVHVESRGGRVLGRSQSSLSRFSGGGHTHMRGKENIRSNTSAGSWSVRGNPKTRTREPLGHFVSRDSKRKQSQIETSVSCSGFSSEGVTTCPMGVVVLKGREEYETRGQGKQFFSDVWKCAMEVERRCAHERAHSLHILKKKRLEQQKAEKRHKAELLREKSIARQREAVKMQLKSVAALKARREGIVQRHRAVERKRFLKKRWSKENSTILDEVEDCEIQGSASDLTSTQRLLCVCNPKAWLKLQALHKQLYLNVLAEKNWMRR